MCNRKYNWSVYNYLKLYCKYFELLSNTLNYSRFSAVSISHLHFDLCLHNLPSLASLAIQGDPCSSSCNCSPLAGVVHVQLVSVGVHAPVIPGDRLRSICARSDIKVAKLPNWASVLSFKRNFAQNLVGCPDIKGILNASKDY